MPAPSYQVIWQDIKREIGNKMPYRAKIDELKRLEQRLEGGRLTPKESMREAEELQTVSKELSTKLQAEGYPNLARFVEMRSERYHPDRYDPEFAL